MDDLQLLDDYARTGSESAFTQVVSRHCNMVYGVCLRQLNDAALAEDTTQAVFLILATKAGKLKDVVVPGWLFQTAKFASANALKLESRRKRAELAAMDYRNQKSSDDKMRDALTAAILDETLMRMSDAERNVLVLRFYRGMDLKEIGMELRISTEAAEKRVSRALERVKKLFFKEGLVCSLPALAGVLASNAAQVAPAALTNTVAQLCTAGIPAAGASAGAAIAKGTIQAMNGFKLKLGAAAIAAALMIGATAGTIGYTAGATKREAESAPTPVPTRDAPVVAGHESQPTLLAARLEFERRLLLDAINRKALADAKSFRDRTNDREKAGQVTRVDVSNAEIAVRSQELAQLQGGRLLDEARSALADLTGGKDPVLNHKAVLFGDNQDLQSDEKNGVVELVDTKDGKVSQSQNVFKAERITEADLADAMQRKPEAERGAARRQLEKGIAILKEKEIALMLEAQRFHFAAQSDAGARVSFERGLVSSSEVVSASECKLKAQAEFVCKRGEYLLQLGDVYSLLGKDPTSITVEASMGTQTQQKNVDPNNS